MSETMPSRDNLLRHLWEAVINVDHVTEGKNAGGYVVNDDTPPFGDVSEAMRRLLATGASQKDIQTVLRYSSYCGVFSTLFSLSDPGVGEGEHAFYLYEELLMADPSGNEGRPHYPGDIK